MIRLILIEQLKTLKIKLIENLIKLNSFNNNYTDSIKTLLSLETPTIILTQQNTSDVKNRMFSIRDKLNSNPTSTSTSISQPSV